MQYKAQWSFYTFTNKKLFKIQPLFWLAMILVVMTSGGRSETEFECQSNQDFMQASTFAQVCLLIILFILIFVMVFFHLWIVSILVLIRSTQSFECQSHQDSKQHPHLHLSRGATLRNEKSDLRLKVLTQIVLTCTLHTTFAKTGASGENISWYLGKALKNNDGHLTVRLTVGGGPPLAWP